MTGRLIDVKGFAADVRARAAELAAGIKQQHGLVPGLTVVIVGEDPASQVYVRNKGIAARECGYKSEEIRLDAGVSQAELIATVERLNADPTVHGILVQLPLPPQIDELAVIDTIDPEKDVDGFHVINSGRLFVGMKATVPCTPLGCIMLLKKELGPDGLAGQNAVVVGRSNIVGKPMAQLLLQESCTVTIAHSKTRDLPGLCRTADILVAAVGRPKMIKGDWVKPGATVIDVGINRIDAGAGKTRLVGDVDTEEALKNAALVTPVPGGIGVLTVAVLMASTLTVACRQAGLPDPDFG